jgi:hypothetical protein
MLGPLAVRNGTEALKGAQLTLSWVAETPLGEGFACARRAVPTFPAVRRLVTRRTRRARHGGTSGGTRAVP